MKFLNGIQPLSLLILRVALAVIFIYHGYPKLVHADAGMREFFILHGLPAYFVTVAAILETFGGLLLLLGLFTRPAALLLAGEMFVAIWKVHSVHGVMAVKEYEFPLALATACFVLATTGAGTVSFDNLMLGDTGGKKRRTSKSNKN
jgi:putative oxidoreductase